MNFFVRIKICAQRRRILAAIVFTDKKANRTAPMHPDHMLFSIPGRFELHRASCNLACKCGGANVMHKQLVPFNTAHLGCRICTSINAAHMEIRPVHWLPAILGEQAAPFAKRGRINTVCLTQMSQYCASNACRVRAFRHVAFFALDKTVRRHMSMKPRRSCKYHPTSVCRTRIFGLGTYRIRDMRRGVCHCKIFYSNIILYFAQCLAS